VAEYGSELTKSLELLAPTAPTPIVESMLSSYRIGIGGRIDIDDEAGQSTAVGEDGRKAKVQSQTRLEVEGMCGAHWGICRMHLSTDTRTSYSSNLVV